MTLTESSLTINHALHLGRTRKARLKSISSAYQFFRKNAGGIVGQNALSALRLAKAEACATDNRWNFLWENDECIGCDCGNESCPCSSGKPHSSLVCILYDSNDVTLASLGSICEPTYTYRRVVEAELALEAIETPASLTDSGAKRLAVLTTEENESWEWIFTSLIQGGKTDSEADALAWEEIQSIFPRLKSFDGCKP